MINWLEKSDEIIYVTEHATAGAVYLIDAKTGAVKNQIAHRSVCGARH